jgi:hypothetical protein
MIQRITLIKVLGEVSQKVLYLKVPLVFTNYDMAIPLTFFLIKKGSFKYNTFCETPVSSYPFKSFVLISLKIKVHSFKC